MRVNGSHGAGGRYGYLFSLIRRQIGFDSQAPLPTLYAYEARVIPQNSIARKRRILVSYSKQWEYPSREKTRYNTYFRIAQRKRYAERKRLAIDILGGECVRCGLTEQLQFDHIDPKLKSFTITTRLTGAAWYVIMEELALCQLLCYPCHKIKTREDRSHRDVV